MKPIAANREIVLYQANLANRALDTLRNPWIITLLIGYIIIALCVVLFMARADKYVSEFSFVLPTAGSTSRVTLEEVGQVSQSSTSAFGNNAISPLSNYKQILASAAVKESAASKLGVDRARFDSLKIKTLQQTSIIEIKVDSENGDDANQKSWALIEAFQDELDRLRLDEAQRYELSIERMLASHRTRLNKTRAAIVDFQQRSLLVSTSQMDKTVSTLSKVREDLTFAKSERASVEKYMRRLSSHLGVSPDLAGYALSLQSDTQFGAYLAELDEAAAQLSRFQSQWGENHPKVRAEKQRFNNVLVHLQQRSTDVIGAQSSRVLHEMNLGSAIKLSELFSDLLDAGAKTSGLEAKISELEHAEARIDDELRVFAREYAELERLEREHQRAEAIYNAAAAKLEQGKTDSFSSYPIVQLLGQPSLPLKPASSKTKGAFAVALVGLILLHIGVLILWQRDKLINLLLKRY